MSEIKLKDIKEVVDAMCPIKIYINGNEAWDDDEDDIEIYNALFAFNYIVKEIRFKVVSFHHTIVIIKTEGCYHED